MTRRQQSRMAQNNRRKIQRRMARILTEKTGEKVNWKESVKMYESGSFADTGLESLYKTYQSQVARRTKTGEVNKQNVYGQNVEYVGRSILSFTEIRFGEGMSVKRRNEMFQRDIAQSTRKNGLSTLSSELTHGFYAATQYMWEKASSTQQRNADIMREFGINDLEQIYKLVTRSELKASDFGFEDEDMFNQWLEQIKDNVDLDELRRIFQEQLGDIARAHENGGDTNEARYNGNDTWDERYKRIQIRIQNIRKQTAKNLHSRF